jgi:hypothetical protein
MLEMNYGKTFFLPALGALGGITDLSPDMSAVLKRVLNHSFMIFHSISKVKVKSTHDKC